MHEHLKRVVEPHPDDKEGSSPFMALDPPLHSSSLFPPPAPSRTRLSLEQVLLPSLAGEESGAKIELRVLFMALRAPWDQGAPSVP